MGKDNLSKVKYAFIERVLKRIEKEKMKNRTLNYYNTNAKSFVSSTLVVDFTETQDKFLHLLPPTASILDFGCGSGRDTRRKNVYIVEQF